MSAPTTMWSRLGMHIQIYVYVSSPRIIRAVNRMSSPASFHLQTPGALRIIRHRYLAREVAGLNL